MSNPVFLIIFLALTIAIIGLSFLSYQQPRIIWIDTPAVYTVKINYSDGSRSPEYKDVSLDTLLEMNRKLNKEQWLDINQKPFEVKL